MSVLSEQINTLHALARSLEASMSEALSNSEKLSTDAFRTIQRVDYLRQSLKDIGAIMAHIGGGVRWEDGQEVRITDLLDIVDMRESLRGLHPATESASHVHDIWL